MPAENRKEGRRETILTQEGRSQGMYSHFSLSTQIALFNNDLQSPLLPFIPPNCAQAETYKIYIYKVLKQVHPDTGISSKAMSIMNSFINVSPSTSLYIAFHGAVSLPDLLNYPSCLARTPLRTPCREPLSAPPIVENRRHPFSSFFFSFFSVCRISLTRSPPRPRTWLATTRSLPLLLAKFRPPFVSFFPENCPSTPSPRAPRPWPSSPLVKYSLLSLRISHSDWFYPPGKYLWVRMRKNWINHISYTARVGFFYTFFLLLFLCSLLFHPSSMFWRFPSSFLDTSDYD